jgi:hypothetical protein
LKQDSIWERVVERPVEQLQRGRGDDHTFDAGRLWRNGNEGCWPTEWSAAGGWRAESAMVSIDLVQLDRRDPDEAHNRPLFAGVVVTAKVGGSA